MRTNFKAVTPITICLCLVLCGCARMKESTKVIMGTSTKALEEARGTSQSLSRVFKTDYPALYNLVINILKKKNIAVFLHSQRKQRIVAVHFDGQTDTTEVGIFFEEISAQETKMTVVSLSHKHLLEASQLLFFEIEENNVRDATPDPSTTTSKGGSE